MNGRRRWEWARRALVLAVVVAGGTLFAAACDGGGDPPPPGQQVAGGDADKGPDLLRSYGCTTCHSVPGVAGANGKVGPPLTDFGDRSFIAGRLSNDAENLVRWIVSPQSVDPGNAMPAAGVTDADARHIAAYLYTLR